MGQPAIRNIDVHLCPTHGPEKIGAVAEMDITVNREAALHVGHCFTCGGLPTTVASGSITVRFHGELAARALEDSGHGGKLVIGSGNVTIGGPRGMGALSAGLKACDAMAGGRKSLKPSQSYGNCMPESLRQIMHKATGKSVTEDEVMAHAWANGLSKNDPGSHRHGGTSQANAVKILEHFGVPAEVKSGPPTMGDIKSAISERKGVVATVQTGAFWPNGHDALHAALITGLELDDQGHVVAVFMNDTGLGQCGVRIPADKFVSGLNRCPTQPLVITKGPLW